MNPPRHLRSFYRFDLGRLFIFCVSISFQKQSKLAFIFVPTAPLTASHPLLSLPPFVRSNWLKPCCGQRAALWQVCLLSAGFNCFLVTCVILVGLLLTLELLIDTKLLQCEC